MQDMIEAVMHPSLAALHGCWRDFMATQADPRGTRTILRFFARFVDNMLVVDIDDAFYTYRHYGRSFVEAFRIDLSNQTIEHVPVGILPPERRNILEFEYSYVKQTGQPVWRSYTAEFGGVTRTWQRLTLPVGANALIVGAYQVDGDGDGDGDAVVPAAPSPDPIRAGADLLRLVINTVPVELATDGSIAGLAVSLMELTRSRSRAAELQFLADTDPLTGAHNRRRLMERGEEEFARSARYGAPMSVLMFDIDHFKRINDTHGHAAGDEALRRFTSTCLDVLRRSDAMGRCGGEEFAAVLPNTDAAGAATLAERLRQRVASLAIPAGDTLFSFTVSIGVAGREDGDNGMESLLTRADRRLYAAKHGGRNRVIAADPVAEDPEDGGTAPIG